MKVYRAQENATLLWIKRLTKSRSRRHPVSRKRKKKTKKKISFKLGVKICRTEGMPPTATANPAPKPSPRTALIPICPASFPLPNRFFGGASGGTPLVTGFKSSSFSATPPCANGGAGR